MRRNIQLVVVFTLIISGVSLQMYNWISLGNEKNNVDEVHDLYSKISPFIKPDTKLSFTTSVKTNYQDAILCNYALLAFAPTVITDNNFSNDTILAIDKLSNASAKMYEGYEIIIKKYSETYLMHLMVKK